MSLNQSGSEQTILKALHWLDKQPDNWAEHIKDTNIAVKMYLKSQKPNPSNSFTKEIKTFLKTKDKESASFQQQSPTEEELIDAFLTNKEMPLACSSVSQNQKPSPPAKLSEFVSKEKEETLFPKEKMPFFLDKISLQTLEKTKQDLNIEKEEEALRLLIQLGRNSLQKLFSPTDLD